MEMWTSGGSEGAHDFGLQLPLLSRGAPSPGRSSTDSGLDLERSALASGGPYSWILFAREERMNRRGSGCGGQLCQNRGCSPCSSTPGPHARSHREDQEGSEVWASGRG